MTLLQVKDLAVHYGPVVAVRALSFDLHQGEVLALVGANGAGKSSVVRALMRLERSGGHVTFDGRPLRGLSTEEVVRAGMTLTPEGRQVFGTLTVRENLLLGGWGLPRPTRLARMGEQFDRFPLLGRRSHQLARSLSGGEQQQLALARSLMQHPRVLLLDEPSLGLAPVIVNQIVDMIGELRSEGLSILLIEQRIEQFLAIADRCLTVIRGQAGAIGKPAELKASGELDRAFLGVDRVERAPHA